MTPTITAKKQIRIGSTNDFMLLIFQSRRIHPQTPPEDLPLSESFASLRLFDLNHRAVPLLLHGTHTVASRLPVSAPGDRNRTVRLFMLDFIRGKFQMQGDRAICNRAVTKPPYDFQISGHRRGYIIIYMGFCCTKPCNRPEIFRIPA